VGRCSHSRSLLRLDIAPIRSRIDTNREQQAAKNKRGLTLHNALLMSKINYLAVAAAAFAAFIMSSVYYSPLVLGDVWRAVDPNAAAAGSPSVGRVVGELIRTVVITFVLARLIALLQGGADWRNAVT
jgi:Protein of unknown function (DUF1761)